MVEALETGSVGWSTAELLARHATPQTEAALLQVARGKTVQAMCIALSPQESPAPIDDDDLSRTLSLTVPLEEAWALEATRTMVEHMDGKSTGSHFLESLLAEGYISLLELIDARFTEGQSQLGAPQSKLGVSAALPRRQARYSWASARSG